MTRCNNFLFLQLEEPQRRIMNAAKELARSGIIFEKCVSQQRENFLIQRRAKNFILFFFVHFPLPRIIAISPLRFFDA